MYYNYTNLSIVDKLRSVATLYMRWSDTMSTEAITKKRYYTLVCDTNTGVWHCSSDMGWSSEDSVKKLHESGVEKYGQGNVIVVSRDDAQPGRSIEGWRNKVVELTNEIDSDMRSDCTILGLQDNKKKRSFYLTRNVEDAIKLA